VDNIDLKTLQMLGELKKTRSVSHTATNLHSTQSAVSMTLAKLRTHFNDPLFVRTSSGMEPTPLADELILLASKAVVLLEATLCNRPTFDPATSTRTFRLSLTDVGQMVTLPALLARLRDSAPGVELEITLISEHTPSLLETGKVDLALGFLPPLDAGFFRKRLFCEHFVCVLREDHPRIGSSLTLEAFLAESHALISPTGTGHVLLERALREHKIERKRGIEIPNFLGISAVVEGSDYLTIVPSRLAEYWAQRGQIKVLPLPFPVPEYMVMHHWHGRYMRDPGIQWLRESISQLYV
jgi:DNA-binding transcriptional LysR family regulator